MKYEFHPEAIEPEFVLIVAVMHCVRDPGHRKERVVKHEGQSSLVSRLCAIRQTQIGTHNDWPQE
jgi:hypothetical protein